MIQTVLQATNYSICAEASLAIFFLVFAAVSWRTLSGCQSQLQEHARDAIQDSWEPHE